MAVNTKNNFDINKRVEMSELFFDLIFVYAISKIAQTILQVEDGALPWSLVFKFLMMIIIMTNIWTYQTFHTNRFGMLRAKDVLFLAFNMFVVIYLSNSLNKDFDKTFYPFVICTAILYFSISIQYLINYFETEGNDRAVCRVFFFVTLVCAIISVISLFVPAALHYHFFFTAIAIGVFGPALGYKTLEASPVNFGHLAERFSLLTIILFGEVMIGLASIFEIFDFEWMSIIQFAIVAIVFWTYWTNIENFIDTTKKTAGFILYFAHIVMFIGLLLFNAAIVLSENNAIHLMFRVDLMFAALLMIYGGIFLNLPYFKNEFQSTKPIMWTLAILVLFYFCALFVPHLLLWLTFITVISIFLVFTYHCKLS